MKGRIKFFNYFIACIATLSLATFAACSDDCLLYTSDAADE